MCVCAPPAFFRGIAGYLAFARMANMSNTLFTQPPNNSDLYEQLKAEAAKKRQEATQRARREYQETLRQIEALRCRMGYDPPRKKPKRYRPIVELIADVMPRQKTFTFAEIHKLLTEAQPDREFNQLSVRTTLRQLSKQGMVKSVAKDQAGRVLWAAADAEIKTSPFGSKPLTEVAEIMLRERGPMQPVELVIAIQETGYRAEANPRRMVAALRSSVRRYPGRFTVGDDGKWSACC